MKEFDFNNMPIVEIANEIIIDAVNKGASDIHFDPTQNDLKIRMRIDGVLFDYGIIPEKYKKNMISRIKMIAEMNIMETRLPQDGAIKRTIGDKLLDLRVSSLPTNNNEKIVIRILDYSKSLDGLENLGFTPEALEKIHRLMKVPNGIILVTGATGTGKSTTVYSILQKLNTEDVNIITVEDPIEMDIKGINQVQVQHEIGLDFATVLRSILRQDPNIIMIGEIRDDETARIAVRASITGHLVLSTIHTNNSLNTIERLTDMDVERYLLGSSLAGIISQRLARKICKSCAQKRKTTDYEKGVFKTALNKDVDEMIVANPEGCKECTKGYRGRIAVFEVLVITEAIKDAITRGAQKPELKKLVYNGDVITLLQDGLIKVLAEETTLEEILKIIDLDNDITNYEDDNLKESMEIITESRENAVKQAEETKTVNTTTESQQPVQQATQQPQAIKQPDIQQQQINIEQQKMQQQNSQVNPVQQPTVVVTTVPPVQPVQQPQVTQSTPQSQTIQAVQPTPQASQVQTAQPVQTVPNTTPAVEAKITPIPVVETL